ncbi:hypothetical protein AA103196_2293 [Ameyamaea chiangmaiensis NBRC 103196]|nr:hypothetical protein AA103196_2293 [Ameyamaea chiangmaiensis NBRC 103196]
MISVRLDPAMARVLLNRQVEKDDLPDAQKAGLLSHLRSLSSKALEGLAAELLQQALSHAPDAIRLLRTSF